MAGNRILISIILLCLVTFWWFWDKPKIEQLFPHLSHFKFKCLKIFLCAYQLYFLHQWLHSQESWTLHKHSSLLVCRFAMNISKMTLYKWGCPILLFVGVTYQRKYRYVHINLTVCFPLVLNYIMLNSLTLVQYK